MGLSARRVGPGTDISKLTMVRARRLRSLGPSPYHRLRAAMQRHALGNATFIVAPRERTREIDLAGRAFLHDYRFEEDKDFAILEMIMTGPLVVTHWINLQYYASTVDYRRYGSGNKVLHNVLGGHLGVFEGNRGDLRIGLSFQSLNDGERWMHPPLRLSVFIEAPRAAIEHVLEKHPKVNELVSNEWLHLFHVDAQKGIVSRRSRDEWVERALVERALVERGHLPLQR